MKNICTDFNYAKEIYLTIKLLQERIEYQRQINNIDDVNATQMILDQLLNLRKVILTLPTK